MGLCRGAAGGSGSARGACGAWCPGLWGGGFPVVQAAERHAGIRTLNARAHLHVCTHTRAHSQLSSTPLCPVVQSWDPPRSPRASLPWSPQTPSQLATTPLAPARDGPGVTAGASAQPEASAAVAAEQPPAPRLHPAPLGLLHPGCGAGPPDARPSAAPARRPGARAPAPGRDEPRGAELKAPAHQPPSRRTRCRLCQALPGSDVPLAPVGASRPAPGELPPTAPATPAPVHAAPGTTLLALRACLPSSPCPHAKEGTVLVLPLTCSHRSYPRPWLVPGLRAGMAAHRMDPPSHGCWREAACAL